MEQYLNGRPSVQSQCGLAKFARFVGTAAGYVQRTSRGDVIADAERLLKRSPERSIVAAGILGLVLGTFLRVRV
jgi:hypothetical protein